LCPEARDKFKNIDFQTEADFACYCIDSMLSGSDSEKLKELQELGKDDHCDCEIKNFSRIMLCNAQWPSFSRLKAASLSRTVKVEAKALRKQIRQKGQLKSLDHIYCKFGDEMLEAFEQRPFSWIVEYQQTVLPTIIQSISMLERLEHQFHPRISCWRAAVWLLFCLVTPGDHLIEHASYIIHSIEGDLANIKKEPTNEKENSALDSSFRANLKALSWVAVSCQENPCADATHEETSIFLEMMKLDPNGVGGFRSLMASASAMLCLDILTGGPFIEEPKRFQGLSVIPRYPMGSSNYQDPYDLNNSRQHLWLLKKSIPVPLELAQEILAQCRRHLDKGMDELIDEEVGKLKNVYLSDSDSDSDSDSGYDLRSRPRTRRRPCSKGLAEAAVEAMAAHFQSRRNGNQTEPVVEYPVPSYAMRQTPM
jgi:hypothetical protein